MFVIFFSSPMVFKNLCTIFSLSRLFSLLDISCRLVHTIHASAYDTVYGIKGLRVVDGSIMPEIPASHTNAVIFMIGEKAADMVKRTWNGL